MKLITADNQLLPIQEHAEQFKVFGEFCLKFEK